MNAVHREWVNTQATRIPEYVPMVAVGDGRQLASMGTVSSMELDRVKARDAIAIERYVAPDSRIKTAINYIAAGALFAAALAGLSCTGSSDADDLRADALNLQDAQAAAVLAAGARK